MVPHSRPDRLVVFQPPAPQTPRELVEALPLDQKIEWLRCALQTSQNNKDSQIAALKTQIQALTDKTSELVHKANNTPRQRPSWAGSGTEERSPQKNSVSVNGSPAKATTGSTPAVADRIESESTSGSTKSAGDSSPTHPWFDEQVQQQMKERNLDEKGELRFKLNYLEDVNNALAEAASEKDVEIAKQASDALALQERMKQMERMMMVGADRIHFLEEQRDASLLLLRKVIAEGKQLELARQRLLALILHDDVAQDHKQAMREVLLRGNVENAVKLVRLVERSLARHRARGNSEVIGEEDEFELEDEADCTDPDAEEVSNSVPLVAVSATESDAETLSTESTHNKCNEIAAESGDETDNPIPHIPEALGVSECYTEGMQEAHVAQAVNRIPLSEDSAESGGGEIMHLPNRMSSDVVTLTPFSTPKSTKSRLMTNRQKPSSNGGIVSTLSQMSTGLEEANVSVAKISKEPVVVGLDSPRASGESRGSKKSAENASVASDNAQPALIPNASLRDRAAASFASVTAAVSAAVPWTSRKNDTEDGAGHSAHEMRTARNGPTTPDARGTNMLTNGNEFSSPHALAQYDYLDASPNLSQFLPKGYAGPRFSPERADRVDTISELTRLEEDKNKLAQSIHDMKAELKKALSIDDALETYKHHMKDMQKEIEHDVAKANPRRQLQMHAHAEDRGVRRVGTRSAGDDSPRGVKGMAGALMYRALGGSGSGGSASAGLLSDRDDPISVQIL